MENGSSHGGRVKAQFGDFSPHHLPAKKCLTLPTLEAPDGMAVEMKGLQNVYGHHHFRIQFRVPY